MRYSLLLPLAALATGFVIPDASVMDRISIEHPKPEPDISGRLTEKLAQGSSSIVLHVKDAIDDISEAIETFADRALTGSQHLDHPLEGLSAQSGLGSADHTLSTHGHHDGPNLTVYELIAKSEYTTKLAKLIQEADLVDLLNGTTANFTIFAPIDSAFEKVPKHAPKPSKEFLKSLLSYHVSDQFYPAGRVLATHTVPTILAGKGLSQKPEATPQRLGTHIGLNGLSVNFYSRIIAINIFGTNGVIHAVDSILVPPPPAAEIINLLPGEFSTLELGLVKTGLFQAINDTSNHLGGTLFAPTNLAFKKLGHKINAFLFSKYGEKYLRLLLEYHVSANHTLYSDAYYKASAEDVEANVPKGLFHVDLPTLLKDRHLSIDIARWARFIEMRINGFGSVAVYDGIAQDGVIHAINDVLIPPKRIGGELVPWDGEELEEDDLKSRLELADEDETGSVPGHKDSEL